MKIAVWYHCLLKGPGINPDYAVALLQSQMNALRDSGLYSHANEVHLSVNGNDSDALTLTGFAPGPCELHVNGDGQSELATLRHLQAWLTPGWFVLYFHMKGVCYPDNPVWDRWRKCMEKVCLWNWESCVEALGGYDAVGAHWLTHKKYPMVAREHRYFGGNFWWARSDYLLTLPPVTKDSREARYDAEVWIGNSRIPPLVHDFAPHWPLNCPP
jgi:hypothetical protein